MIFHFLLNDSGVIGGGWEWLSRTAKKKIVRDDGFCMANSKRLMDKLLKAEEDKDKDEF